MKTIDNIPLTQPAAAYRGRYSELDAQAEYVACKQAGLSFAASGNKQQWLYHDGETIAALYPNGDRVFAPYKGLHWIDEAKKL